MRYALEDNAAAPAGGTSPAATTDVSAPAVSATQDQAVDKAAPATAGQDGPVDPDKSAQKPEQSKAERRIGALTAKVRENQREIQRQQDLLRKIGAARQLNPLDFKSDAEYHAALIENSVSKANAEHAKASVQNVTQEMVRAENEIWDTSVEEYTAFVPDFEAVVYSDAVKLPGNVMREMRAIQGGPAVAYFLAKNQGEAHRLAQLPKAEALIELGRLAGRLTATQPKRVTSAIDPPKTVNAGSSGGAFDPQKSSMEDYAANYRKRVEKAR